MAEYIDRQEAIETVAFYLEDPDGIDHALQSIKSIPTADVQPVKWISVTERWPVKRKWVLCRCEANIIEVLRWENNEWYHDPKHVYYPSFVTHWMPLPEPPKGEKT